MSESRPFWEIDHGYPQPQSNFFANFYQNQDYVEECETWTDFLSDWGDLDTDHNHLYRWDYVAPEPGDYDEEGEDIPDPYLSFCYIMQRKGGLFWVRILNPQESDETAIRQFLETRWLNIHRLWEPLNTAPAIK